jgi:hypothetical protein
VSDVPPLQKSKLNFTRMNTFFNTIQRVFFPTNFTQKYSYLGRIPLKSEEPYFQALVPLILAMDRRAKPKWCPRWVLRILAHLSVKGPYVKNPMAYKIYKNLTKGIWFVDWKTKWEPCDLRISIYGPDDLLDMADSIESDFYRKWKNLI